MTTSHWIETRLVVPTDAELRINHEFVTAFETLRKQYGHREMSDAAVRHVAEATAIPYETLRISRHLRNALAHGDSVNRETLTRHLAILRDLGSHDGAPKTAESASSPDGLRAFRVHAWRDPSLEREMLANGFVSVGGSEMGDLSDVRDPEVIRSRITDSMPDRSTRAISLFVGYWRRFLWEARAGDIVVLPTQSGSVSIGEFVGPYHYVVDAEPRARHRRAVGWIGTAISRDAFGDDLLVTIKGQHTVQDFKAPCAVARLKMLAERGLDPGPR